MAAAVLLRSVARKMSRAAAPTHHRSLVPRGFHGEARSAPANSNQVQGQQGMADVLVSEGMAAACVLRSGAGRLTTKMAHAPPPPPPPYHRLVHGRGIHNRASPDQNPPTPKKATGTAKFIMDLSAAGYISALSSFFYLQFWFIPRLKEINAMLENLHKEREEQLNSIRNMADSPVSRQTRTAPASGETDKLQTEGEASQEIVEPANLGRIL